MKKIIISVLILTICYLFVMTKLEYYRESNLISLTNQTQITSSNNSISSSSSSSVEEKFSVEISGYVAKPGSYKMKDCPCCKNGQRLDAIVNAYGYSKI